MILIKFTTNILYLYIYFYVGMLPDGVNFYNYRYTQLC